MSQKSVSTRYVGDNIIFGVDFETNDDDKHASENIGITDFEVTLTALDGSLLEDGVIINGVAATGRQSIVMSMLEPVDPVSGALIRPASYSAVYRTTEEVILHARIKSIHAGYDEVSIIEVRPAEHTPAREQSIGRLTSTQATFSVS